jgi:hypothetical protein
VRIPSTPTGNGCCRPWSNLRRTRATADLVESHCALRTVSPSGPAARRLIGFWRERTADGDLVWDLADEELSTRSPGDLYQDLSDYAKKTFALRQTPEFVEELVLGRTLEPAPAERPLEGFTFIDPTCGSGHFLLGAFARPHDRWAAQAPGEDTRIRVQRALDAIHGVDLNPFAVAIARFRLLVAALRVRGETSLETAPAFRSRLAAGDPLPHGAAQLSTDDFGIDSGTGGFAYATEDLQALRRLLVPGRYDVVVGNPPVHRTVLPARQEGERRQPGRLDRADHLEFLHERRVRIPPHRGGPAQAGPPARRGHLRVPRQRHPRGHQPGRPRNRSAVLRGPTRFTITTPGSPPQRRPSQLMPLRERRQESGMCLLPQAGDRPWCARGRGRRPSRSGTVGRWGCSAVAGQKNSTTRRRPPDRRHRKESPAGWGPERVRAEPGSGPGTSRGRTTLRMVRFRAGRTGAAPNSRAIAVSQAARVPRL